MISSRRLRKGLKWEVGGMQKNKLRNIAFPFSVTPTTSTPTRWGLETRSAP
jgi:hypothetical protein